MRSDYKHNFELKYGIHISVLDGFLYFFGLKENPYKKIYKKMRERSDIEALRSDWQSVGNDFNVVIERERNNLKLEDACQ
jgi:hypothetical protein